MVCCTLDAIKATTKMQVDTFIHFSSVDFFNAMKFISMVIVKEIIFTCVMYAVTVCGTDLKQSLNTRTD